METHNRGDAGSQRDFSRLMVYLYVIAGVVNQVAIIRFLWTDPCPGLVGVP